MRLRCEVLKGPYGDCSNGGISSEHGYVLLTDEHDCPLVVNGTPTVKVVRRYLPYEYLHVEPRQEKPDANVGYMMGGCYIMGSTKMGFPSKYPLPLYDRSETPEQYKALST